MPAFTPFLNLYKPGGGSTGLIVPDEVADIDRLNANFDSIDAFAKSWGAATSRQTNNVDVSSQLANVVGMKVGDTFQETDGNKVRWRYDGSNWVTDEGGLFKVRPASVVGAGVTIAPNGDVVFTNVNDITADILGMFSSRFRNYRMVTRFTAKGSVGIDMQCLNGSTPYTAASYFSNTQAYVNNTRQDSYTGASQWLTNLISLFTGAQAGSALEIYTPNEAQRTTFMGNAFATGGVLSNAVSLASLETSDVVTGLRIRFPAGAAATGTLSLYGYA